MTLDFIQLNYLKDQQKILNFCLDQIVAGNEVNASEEKKTPYSIIALIAIDNIVQLISASNEK